MKKKINLLTWMYISFLFCFCEILTIYVSKIWLRMIYILFVFIIINMYKLIPFRKIDQLICIYFFYMCIRLLFQLLGGSTTEVTYVSFLQTIIPIFVYFIAIRLDYIQAEKIENLFCFFCALSVLTGIVNKVFNFLPASGAFSGGLYASLGSTYVERGYSLAGNALNTGYMCALAIGFLIQKKDKEKFLWRYLFLIVAVIGSLLSYSRGAIACIAAIIFTFALKRIKRDEIKVTSNRIVITIIIMVIVLMLILVNGNLIMESSFFQRFVLNGLTLTDGSNAKRIEFINNALESFCDSLLFGRGFGFSGYQAAANNVSGLINTESYILLLGIDGGVIAIILFCAINLCVYQEIKKRKKIIKVKYYAIIVGIFAWSIFYILLDSDITALFYWYSLGRIFERNEDIVVSRVIERI